MTVPSRVAAVRLLLSLGPPPWHVRHSRAVAEVAAWLALRIERAGHEAIDRRVVEAGALLHDVDKALPAAERGPLPNGAAGAAWVTRNGYAELAAAVALHPVTNLADDRLARTVDRASLEARVVAYADKRAGQRLEPMTLRFEGWRRRYPTGWSVTERALAWDNALRLESDVCARAGCRPGEVGRLGWTRAAFAERRG